jgi:hypothetical protein
MAQLNNNNPGLNNNLSVASPKDNPLDSGTRTDRPTPEPGLTTTEPTLMAQLVIDERPVTYTETSTQVDPFNTVTDTPTSKTTSELRTENQQKTSLEQVRTVTEQQGKLQTPINSGQIGVPPTLNQYSVDPNTTTPYYQIDRSQQQLSVGSGGTINFSGSQLLNTDGTNVFATYDAYLNPNARTGETAFSVGAGVKVTSPTQTEARDIDGNLIKTQAGQQLYRPTALGAREVWRDFVPDQVIPAQRIENSNGVYKIQPNSTAVIDKPNPSQSGRDQSAYTQNVGGVIVRNGDSVSFVPMWNADGHLQQSTTVNAGNNGAEIVQALVPEQPGQDLQLGKQYPVTKNPDGSYSVGQDNKQFSVIAADTHPENFKATTNPDVFAVEDTLANQPNASKNSIFNGVPGTYYDPISGNMINTNDGNDATTIANVNTPEKIIPGQDGYLQVTGGVTVGASLNASLNVGQVENIKTTRTDTYLNQNNQEKTYRDSTTVNGTLRTEQSGSITTTTVDTFNATEQTVLNPDGSLSTNVVDPKKVNSVSNSATDLGPAITSTVDQSIFTSSELIDEQNTSQRTLIDSVIRTDRETELAVVGELKAGAFVQLTLKGTPGTPAADTLAIEAYVATRTDGTGGVGATAELVLNPFGSKTKPGVDAHGNPLYKTKPVLNADGTQKYMTVGGKPAAVNEFDLDQNGNRIPLRIETGESKGPQVYVRGNVDSENGARVEIGGRIRF